MPTYQYACTECGDRLEVRQAFTDDPLTTCPACSGALRKLFNAVGVVFKGSGFYRNDSRTAPAEAGAKTDGRAASNGAGGKDAPSSGEGASKGAPSEKPDKKSPTETSKKPAESKT